MICFQNCVAYLSLTNFCENRCERSDTYPVYILFFYGSFSSCFQNNVEIHINHIQSGLIRMGNLHAFSSTFPVWCIHRNLLLTNHPQH